MESRTCSLFWPFCNTRKARRQGEFYLLYSMLAFATAGVGGGMAGWKEEIRINGRWHGGLGWKETMLACMYSVPATSTFYLCYLRLSPHPHHFYLAASCIFYSM